MDVAIHSLTREDSGELSSQIVDRLRDVTFDNRVECDGHLGSMSWLTTWLPAASYGRALRIVERAMDNFGAIGGPLLALALVAALGVRTAILLSIIPGLLAVAAIVYAIRHFATAD